MSGVELGPLIGTAGARLVKVAHGVGEHGLSAVTPCEAYDARGLLNHLLYWGPILERAARKAPIPDDRPAEGEVDLTANDWQTVLAAQVDGVASAWADPAAWEGTTSVGQSALGDLPASLVGSIVLMEFVIHGWDLARATGQPFEADDKAVEAVREYLALTVEHGRTLGAFGPEVPVSADAPILHRTLGVSGRDPGWSVAAS